MSLRFNFKIFLTGLLTTTTLAAQQAVVSVATSTSEPIAREIRATGTVTAPRSALLSTAVGGIIRRYRVDIGANVKAGDLLVELDARLARAALEGAEASRAETRTALEDARRRLAEAERLGGEEGVIAATEIESRRAEVQGLEAGLGVSAARVREAQELLARHTIRAPFAGVVSERPAEIGEWVNPGDPLLRLVATDALQFDFRLPQDVFGGVREGTPVTLSADSLPGETFPGRAAAVVPVSDPGNRTFLLRAVPDAAEGLERVVPGMSARVQLDVATGRNGVVVPRDALVRFPDGRTVVWVTETRDGETVARERRVTLGQEFGGRVELREGLEAGRQVVVRGNEGLRDGQAVAIRPLTTPTQ